MHRIVNALQGHGRIGDRQRLRLRRTFVSPSPARQQELSVAARYVLSRSGSQFQFVLKAGNNEVVLSSERYITKQGALSGIASVRVNSLYDDRYERLNAINGQPMFNLQGANGERIGISETYTSPGAREIGIQSVMKNGPEGPIDDQT
jgi:uncharacterized protein YegP (UPF0339 family)